MRKRTKITFTAGGTGGHVYPALAVAGEVRRLRPDVDIEFIGRHASFEEEKVSQEGYQFVGIAAKGWSRAGLSQNLAFPLVLFFSTARIVFHFLLSRPAAVFATGGYVTAPSLFAARFLRIPIYLQEQNTYPGWVTRVLARSARKIFLGFEEATRYLPQRSRSRTVVLGMPIRPLPSNVSREEVLKRHGLDPNRKVFLIFGGSQGSRTLNHWMRAAAQPIIERTGTQIVWQTGLREWQTNGFNRSNDGLKVVPYLDPIYDFLSVADLILCRAGASTLAEIAAFGVPSIMVPFPHATDNHQEKNARFFEAQGAGICLIESSGSPEKVVEVVTSLLNDPSQMESMRGKCRRLGHPEATQKTAEEFLRSMGVA